MFSKTVVNHPVGFLVIYMVLFGIGGFTLGEFLTEFLPEVDLPFLSVSVSFTGASPEEVENTITKLYEGILSQIGGLKNITATSTRENANFFLEFDYGTNLDVKKNELRDKLGQVPTGILPDGVGSPVIEESGPSQMPFMLIGYNSDKNSDELYKIIEDNIKPELQRIQGVAIAYTVGGRDLVLKVRVDKNLLDSYQLNIEDVRRALMAQNVKTTAGEIKEGNMEYLFDANGSYKNIEEIENTVIAQKRISLERDKMFNVRIGDIATVNYGYSDYNMRVKVNGRPGVMSFIIKQSSANSVKLSNSLKPVIAQTQKKFKGVFETTLILDSSSIVVTSINGVVKSAQQGGIIAILAVLIFLRSIKSTLIIGLSIPTSIVITLIFMVLTGTTLNIMSLSGLALGIGMVVDASVVVLENTFKYREKGAKLKISAALGAKEMMMPVISSTLTTVAVFLPPMIFKYKLEAMGMIFFDLCLTVVISLMASMFVALTLIPVLSSKYLKIYTKTQKPITFPPLQFIDTIMEKFFVSLDNFYANTLMFGLRYKFFVLLSIVVLLFGLTGLGVKLVGFELSPAMPEDTIIVNVVMPIGASMEDTYNELSRISKLVNDTVGTDNFKNTVELARPSGQNATIFFSLKPKEQLTMSSLEMKTALGSRFKEFLPTKVEFASMGGGFGGGAPVVVNVSGNNYEDVKKQIDILTPIISKIDGVYNVKNDFQDGIPQVSLKVDRQRMHTLGLNIQSVVSELKTAIKGSKSSRYKVDGKEYDILVEYSDQYIKTTFDISDVMVTSPAGVRIPVSSFATLEKNITSSKIVRKNRVYEAKIEGYNKVGYNMSDITPLLDSAIKSVPEINGVSVKSGGNDDTFKRLGAALALIFTVSLLLIYGIMAAQFESILDPLIIFSSIPLMFIGISLIHILIGNPFSLFTGIGMIILSGIVINNGIVLIDYTNLLRGRGLELIEACIEAGRSRLRPILLTSLTTILGMLPMIISGSDGADYMKPIAQAVVGGMISSTFMTLLYIPTVYVILNSKIIRLKSKKSRMIETKLVFKKVKSEKV